ncbi:MAG: cytochrome P460 family protein [Dongiaceae bacterium]
MTLRDVTIGRARNLVLAGIGVFAVLAALLPGATVAQDSHTAFADSGELQRPEGYREWIFVGAPVTPNDLNGGAAPFPEFHAVYIDPASWAHWQETGEFRDSTILVKELSSVGSKDAASGKGYFMGEFIGLEATVKSASRFPDEPGNWAYFSFTNADNKSLKPTAAAMPTDSCNACHDGAAAQDWVFTQYYPVLRAAKPNP